MKTAPFVLLMLLVIAPARAQDPKAQLAQVMAAAQKAYDAGKLDEAEEALNGAKLLVHDDFKAILLRARVNFGLGEFGKATTYAERAAELDAQNVDARMLVGKALYQQAEAAKSGALNSGSKVNGFYEGALTEFEKASKIKPDHPDIPGWRAECLFWLDRVPEAVAVWEAVGKAKPDDPEPFLRIAQMQLKVKNEDEALKIATLGLMTKGASALRGDLATVVFTVLNPRNKQAEMFATFKAWNTKHPEDPLAYLWMGYTRFMEKNFDEAITHYQKGFDASGKKHAGLALELGNASAQTQKPDLAKVAEWYGTALKLQAAWPNYDLSPLGRLNALAYNHVQKLEFAKGIDVLEKYALPAGLQDRRTMNNLGFFYRDWADRDRGKKAEAKARNEKALEYYLKASKLVMDEESATPTDKAQVLNDTGVIYDYQLGNVEKGIEFYRQALQNDPKFVDALENLGMCFNKLGKYEEAIPLFQGVLDQQPGRAKSLNGLGTAKKAVEKDQKPTSR